MPMATRYDVDTTNVVFTGTMHRFPTDKSIRAYCAEHGYHDPIIGDFGDVWAFKHFDENVDNTEVQIGWIA